MARHQDDCPICDQLEACRAGSHPGLIGEMETGYAVLAEMQKWRGYSLLLCRHPATELDELPGDVRARHLLDMALLAQSVRRAVSPHKLNYELLGNQVHHLHWHIIPRYADEADPLNSVRAQWPEPSEQAACRLSEGERRALIGAIRQQFVGADA